MKETNLKFMIEIKIVSSLRKFIKIKIYEVTLFKFSYTIELKCKKS